MFVGVILQMIHGYVTLYVSNIHECYLAEYCLYLHTMAIPASNPNNVKSKLDNLSLDMDAINVAQT